MARWLGRPGASPCAGLYARLVVERDQFERSAAERVAGYSGGEVSAPVRPWVDGGPIAVFGWQLPREVRRVLGVGMNDRVVVRPDDSVAPEGETGWSPQVVE